MIKKTNSDTDRLDLDADSASAELQWLSEDLKK